ncbi:hypothetical protein AQY21_19830 [Paracoccus sp. MKU1]|nr:hypothetical protein AQY21_19830 [Paracoccus sp. MKU1]
MSEIITVGLDLAKNVFQAHGADASGRALLRKKLRRDQVLAFFGQLPPCVVDDAIGAGAAGILRAAGDDDTELGGHDVEPFRDIFPDAVQAAAAGAGQAVRFDDLLDARQVLWQRSTIGGTRFGRALGGPILGILFGMDHRHRSFQIFQRQFERKRPA